MTTQIDDTTMANIVRETLGIELDKSYTSARSDETHRGFFGAPIKVITLLWNQILPLLTKDEARSARPKHLLWALVFLKVYSTTQVHCCIVRWPDPKTYRKWSWLFVYKIAQLKYDIIRLDNRFDKWNQKSQALMSIDGVDCMANEPFPFDTTYYSQKFNGPALKYEVGVSIATGYIVWTNGPFKAGKPDAEVFKDDLVHLLAEDEVVEADGGYRGHNKLMAPTVATSRVDRKAKSVVRGRHENINGRLKIFNVLVVPFRHSNPRNQMHNKHGACFDAIAVITQLKLENGESLYDVDYDVTYD